MTLRSPDYELQVRWTSLAGPSDPGDLCVVAEAADIHGNAARAATYNCTAR